MATPEEERLREALDDAMTHLGPGVMLPLLLSVPEVRRAIVGYAHGVETAVDSLAAHCQEEYESIPAPLAGWILAKRERLADLRRMLDEAAS